jgi:hypothetical protein
MFEEKSQHKINYLRIVLGQAHPDHLCPIEGLGGRQQKRDYRRTWS